MRRTKDIASKPLPEVIKFNRFTLNTLTEELYLDAKPVPLQVQEYLLLLFLASHPNQVLSREILLNEVWGYDSGSTTRTVDVHIANLRHKLEESKVPKNIHTIRGRGYRFSF